ncbi:unnamed protein product [Dicrocoelium dendriticum]|nr:unnamed protein product [Dicrocoelium dendriticum]
MERDMYPRQWVRGSVAMERKKLVAQGLLNKYAKPGETPPIPSSIPAPKRESSAHSNSMAVEEPDADVFNDLSSDDSSDDVQAAEPQNVLKVGSSESDSD